jgi:hypothetical protein
MKLLKNILKWDSYFDIESNEEIINSNYLPIIGWFTYIDGNMSKLYVENGELYFSYIDFLLHIKKCYFVRLKELKQLDDHTISKVFSLFEKRLFKKDKKLLEFEYTAEVNYNIPPFDYIDDEDSDWGLFVANIINSTERKKNLLKNKDGT